MRISDWSSDVCSSDLTEPASLRPLAHRRIEQRARSGAEVENAFGPFLLPLMSREVEARLDQSLAIRPRDQRAGPDLEPDRSEEHTSELQSLMRISYAVFCLKKKNLSQII